MGESGNEGYYDGIAVRVIGQLNVGGLGAVPVGVRIGRAGVRVRVRVRVSFLEAY